MNSTLRHFALGYLLERIVYRVFIFLHHWFVDGSMFFFRAYTNLLVSMERTFAVRITFHHLFEPLYGDYSAVGRVVGPIFRVGRSVVGIFLYTLFTLAVLLIY